MTTTPELPPEFCSGNAIPVERATISRARMLEILREHDARQQSVGVAKAMAGYLRVCRCGGMPTKTSDLILGAVEQAEGLGYFKGDL